MLDTGLKCRSVPSPAKISGLLIKNMNIERFCLMWTDSKSSQASFAVLLEIGLVLCASDFEGMIMSSY